MLKNLEEIYLMEKGGDVIVFGFMVVLVRFKILLDLFVQFNL